jgi:flagellar hook-associated protein 3 FlgL
MISGLNPANEQFVTSLNDLQARFNNTQQQLSSGLRVNQASDAPQELGDIFQARSDLSQANQVTQNLTTVKSQVDTADSALQSAAQLLDQAGVLAAQGVGTTVTADQRQALALQVQAIQAQLVGLSRSQVDGVYIFSGDVPGSPAYQLNPASPTGVDRLLTTQATQQIADTTGVTFPIALTAQDLFDKRDAGDNPAPENVFAAVNSLQQALQANDPAGISTAIDSLHTASTYLNQQLGFYGATQNHISASLDLAQKFQVQTQTRLSDLQDTDVTSAAVELTQETTNLSAMMSAQARRPQSTLFDYLPVG